MNIKTEIDKSRAMKAKMREGSQGMNMFEERRRAKQPKGLY